MMSADKRRTMMDDERYPIAVIPEGIDFRGEEKIATPISAVSTSTYPSYPPDYKTASLAGGAIDENASTSTLAVPGTVAAERGFTERNFAKGPSYAEAQLPPRSEAKRPWWKKKSIVLLLVLIFTVMIVSMIGGIYAHNIRQKNTGIGSNTSTSSGETTVAQVQNSTLNSVASSGLFLNDKTTWNMQTYWQTSTGSIMRQMSLDGTTFKTAKNLTLQIAPKVGSPLSATATTDTSGIVYLTLFYITADNKIAMSGQACAAGTASCSSTTNAIISSNLSTRPSNWTGLAAINVDDAQDWRVYFYDEQGFVTELAGNPSGFGNGTVIGGNGLNGSSIAATNINSTTNNINLFYVDSLTKALFTMEFNGSWTSPAVLSPERITSWNPFSGLSACYTKTPDQLHMYYTGLDEKIYEFLGTNASSQSTIWGAQPGNNHIWASADYVGADITAVGWKDQVRFFQVSGSKLVQGSLSNTTWTEAFVSATSS